MDPRTPAPRGTGMPRCRQAASVATRPRGVRARRPARTRNGSQTSSTVGGPPPPPPPRGAAPPPRPPPELGARRGAPGAVQPVQAELVDVVERQRRAGDL